MLIQNGYKPCELSERLDNRLVLLHPLSAFTRQAIAERP